MGVYIPKMEMPRNCDVCPIGDCPLVEVKQHGRLIDADALTQRYFQFPPVTFALSYAPTIIEREEEDGI